MKKLLLLIGIGVLSFFRLHAGNIQPEKIDSLKNLAEKAYRNGEYPLAVIVTEDLATYYRTLDMKDEEAKQITFLGEIHRASMHFIYALHNLDKALQIAIQVNDQPLIIRIHNRKAATYYESGKFGEAIREADIAIAIAEQYGVTDYTASTLNIKGALLRDMNQVQPAFQAYYKALAISRESEDGDEEITTCYNLAVVFSRLKMLDSAAYYANRGMTLAYGQKRATRIAQGYQQIASAYEYAGDTIKRNEYFKRAEAVYDSLYNTNTRQQKEFVEAAYEAPQKIRENETLRTLNNQIQGGLIALAILCALLIGSTIFIIRRNRQLSELNKTLQVQQTAIAQKNAELASINSIKDKLFSVIAHDLRNPIGSMAMALSFINEGDVTPGEKANLMEKLEKNAIQVQEMLDNLLKWSRSQLQGSTVHPVEFNMNELVLENIELLKAMSVKKNITLRFDASDLPKAYADIEMIRFVIRNLVTNAIKFTQAGGQITISARPQKDRIVVSVKDNGIGIPREKLGTIFSITGETSYGTDNERGSGLGLALCEEFIRKNKGMMDVESEPGKGSTFTFTVLAAA
jgi:signal transduction histidine kinase